MDKYQAAKEFLDQIYKTWSPKYNNRPFVTLTYAQSLDGYISKRGHQVLLSGQESMAMTHRLRLLHDGILVGSGTALIDNPQLNARHVPEQDIQAYPQPQPIIIDSKLELPLDCKLLQNYREKRGRQPWLITTTQYCSQNPAKQKALKEAGARILMIDGAAGTHLDIRQVLELLRREGIERLMVEGGAKIIQSFLADSQQVVDQLVVTIAPTFIGNGGVSATSDKDKAVLPSLTQIHYCQFGVDMVLSAKPSFDS